MTVADFSFEGTDGLCYTIRPMDEADLPEILAIEQRAHSHPWRPEHFENCLNAGYLALVVEAAEVKPSETSSAGSKSPVAYALASAGGGQADLLNLVVAPEMQRRGIARALLLFLLGLLGDEVDSIFLEVRASNHGAIRLYEETGFNQVGIRRDYYPAADGREDALVLALALSMPAE